MKTIWIIVQGEDCYYKLIGAFPSRREAVAVINKLQKHCGELMYVAKFPVFSGNLKEWAERALAMDHQLKYSGIPEILNPCQNQDEPT